MHDQMNAYLAACLLLSITTLDRSLARRMEPRAATPERRLETMQGELIAGAPP